MIASGDLDADVEYINPVVLDFLLFISEVVLVLPSSVTCPIEYDDITVRWARQRGHGVQHEYLIQVNRDAWDDSKQLVLHRLQSVLSSEYWNGSRLAEPT